MAKTKSDLDRTEKRQAILTVARRMFVEDGYDVSAMGRIAEEVGIAPNTLYWYFADKDALLTAVLDALVLEALAEYQTQRDRQLATQMVWLLGKLGGLSRLIATVHARSESSPVVQTWHDNFHRMLEAMLSSELRAHGVPECDLGKASRVAIFVVEGLLAHPGAQAETHALVNWLVSTLQR